MSTDESGWHEKYSVGVAEIDNQHSDLIDQIDDLVNHIQVEGKKYFKKKITAAIRAIINHFETEEELLAKTEYGNFADHQKEHENITTKFLRIQEELRSSTKEVDIINLVVTLKEWFISHILLYDMEAKDYLQAGATEI